MRLFEFVPIYDYTIDDESLVERVFGYEFVVIDELGHQLTTAHNQNLLQRAKTLLERSQSMVGADLERALQDLYDQAEIVRQRDYDAAFRRELRELEFDFERLPDLPYNMAGMP
jgi:polyhydroxyalkanoate synthesis regulator phasin